MLLQLNKKYGYKIRDSDYSPYILFRQSKYPWTPYPQLYQCICHFVFYKYVEKKTQRYLNILFLTLCQSEPFYMHLFHLACIDFKGLKQLNLTYTINIKMLKQLKSEPAKPKLLRKLKPYLHTKLFTRRKWRSDAMIINASNWIWFFVTRIN